MNGFPGKQIYEESYSRNNHLYLIGNILGCEVNYCIIISYLYLCVILCPASAPRSPRERIIIQVAKGNRAQHTNPMYIFFKYTYAYLLKKS